MRSPESPREILPALHALNPYAGFNAHDYPLDLQGWNGDAPIFDLLIGQIRPQLIIEVGSWKGQSAITMGRSLLRHGLRASILCIDTWLGAIEFWTDQHDPTRYISLRHKHGYPTVYYQFLANVVHCGLQDVIIPFPQTSAIAARWLAQQGIRAEMIYIDGSHDEPDVRADLDNYWPLLADGGYLFGDDINWPSVRLALDSKWPGTYNVCDGFWVKFESAK